MSLLNLLFLNSAIICSWHPLHLNLEHIFLYRFVSSFLHLPPSCYQPCFPTPLFHKSAWILPKLNLISLYNINGLFPDLAIIFRLFISLHLSLIIFVICISLHSSYFLLRNVNQIFCSSSFNSLVRLLTPLLMLLPYITLLYRIFCTPHIIRYKYFNICPIHLPLLLSLPNFISANSLAAQFYILINFLQILCA